MRVLLADAEPTILRCARSFSTPTGSRGSRTCPSRAGPACSCACAPAGSAAPTSRSSGARPRGTVLGHEVAGELEDGSRVTVMHRVPCGICERCRAGHQSTCGEFRASADRARAASPRRCARRTACRCRTCSTSSPGSGSSRSRACSAARERVPRGRVLVVGCGAIGLLWSRRCGRAATRSSRPTCDAERLERALALGAARRRRSRRRGRRRRARRPGRARSRGSSRAARSLVFAAPHEPVPTWRSTPSTARS